jgi:Uncharacterized protein with SCP/PR1 domains
MEGMLRRHPNPGTARRLTLGGLLAIVLALGASLLPALPAHAAGGSTLHSLAQEARAANGLPGLARNPALDAVAEAWAASMAATGTLAHNPSLGAQLPGGWTASAENVAQGQPTEAATHDAWMASAGHRANVLGDYTDVGMAFLDSGGTTWGVQVFATYPASAPAEPAPSTAPAPVEAPAPSSPSAPRAAKGATDAATDPAELPTEAPPEDADATLDDRPTTYRASRPTTATEPDAAAPAADSVGWTWVGIPALGVLALAGGAVLLRARGLIGPSSGRHSA